MAKLLEGTLSLRGDQMIEASEPVANSSTLRTFFRLA